MSDLPQYIGRDIEGDTLRRALQAQVDVLNIAKHTGAKLVQEHRRHVAATLMGAGITLIPSDHLLDHQFCVSRGVYDEAKKLMP